MPAENTKLLDKQAALQASNQNKELAQKLLQLFIQQIEVYIETLSSEHDIPTLQHIVHKLNGASQYIGAPLLKQKLTRLDGHLHTLTDAERRAQMCQLIELLVQIKHLGKYDD